MAYEKPLLLLDAAGPMLCVVLGVATVVILLFVVVVETAVLRLLKWSGVRRCLLDVSLMNLVSFVLGIVLFVFRTPFDELADRWWYLALLATWAASVVSEGAVLALIRRRKASATWRAAFLTNTARACLADTSLARSSARR